MSDDLDQATLFGLIDHMKSCLSQPERGVSDTLDWLRDLSCCDGIILCQAKHPSASSVRHLVSHDYPPKWIQTYLAQDFGKVDPVIRYASLASDIYSWKDAYTHFGSYCPPAFFEKAADYGLHTGVACSFAQEHSDIVTICSICVDNNALPPAAQWALSNVMPALHTATGCIKQHTSIQPLTVRELEVLKWSSEGKTVWETGMILSLSEGTVKFHLSNIYRKLDVTNRAQAIAAAAHQGLI